MGIYINDFISNIKNIFYIIKYKLFKMDCSAAPFNYYVDQMKNEIKYQSQKILEKYFENRDFNKQKVIIWKDYALEEIT